jgi:hypothetical protein
MGRIPTKTRSDCIQSSGKESSSQRIPLHVFSTTCRSKAVRPKWILLVDRRSRLIRKSIAAIHRLCISVWEWHSSLLSNRRSFLNLQINCMDAVTSSVNSLCFAGFNFPFADLNLTRLQPRSGPQFSCGQRHIYIPTVWHREPRFGVDRGHHNRA